MRRKAFGFAVAALSLLAGDAQAGSYAVFGNHNGGLIPWSPAVDDVYREVAAEHCAWYKRVAHITSVNRSYGEFIGFTCRFDRTYDPVKNR
jgi:hypothetical protein